MNKKTAKSLIVLGIVLGMCATKAWSVIYTVTSPGDGSNGGTLREAVASANTNPDKDTINIALSPAPGFT